MARRKKPAVTVRSQIEAPAGDAGQAEVLDYLRLLERVKAYKAARDDILVFAQLMMPDLNHPLDVSKSQYQITKHVRVMAHAIHEQVKGHIPRLIVTMPPRHGKTQIVTKFQLAWLMGKFPHESNIMATYNSDLAGDFGREVRAIVQSDTYRAIFPEFELRAGSAASDRLVTKEGGTTIFAGRGGALSGRGAHRIIVDDLIKDAAEADSQLVRDKIWQWWAQVLTTRLMSSVGTSILLTFTRWHEDDPIGRLTDPQNPHYNAEEAAKWKIINCPFFAEENDSLGRKPGEILWPERFDREFGESQKRLDPRAFNALYQQRPSATDGTYFKKSWFHYYDDMPKKHDMRIFAASDHAVATGQRNDKTCMVIAGVDKLGDIYMLDTVWGRFDAQQQVDKMIEMMIKWEPQYWWAEKQHMGQALGPFLRKKKMEAGVSTVVEEVHASKDKETRARSLQGLMADGRVYWPRRGWWRLAAEDEILKFPQGTYDDFVDAASWLGMKVQQMYAAREIKVEKQEKRNSWAWFKKEMAFQEGMRETNDGNGW